MRLNLTVSPDVARLADDLGPEILSGPAAAADKRSFLIGVPAGRTLA